jgi:hypothetical protein
MAGKSKRPLPSNHAEDVNQEKGLAGASSSAGATTRTVKDAFATTARRANSRAFTASRARRGTPVAVALAPGLSSRPASALVQSALHGTIS